VTAFSAGRRAAGYSTGEIPVYSDADEQPGRGGQSGDRSGSATGDRGRHASGDSAGEEPTGRKARKRGKDSPPAEEAPSRQRRGLFGRRRAAPAPEPAAEPAGTLDVPTQRGGQPRPEAPLKPRDEEYVDWVSGLSSRDADPHDPSR
jgi:hypothetical protein